MRERLLRDGGGPMATRGCLALDTSSQKNALFILFELKSSDYIAYLVSSLPIDRIISVIYYLNKK